MARTENYVINMKFNGDMSHLQQQVKNVQLSLTELTRVQTKDMGLQKQFREASQAAKEMKQHIAAATNVQTGNIDLSKLNTSLQKSKKTLTSYMNTFASAGAQGQRTFMNMAKAITAAELPMRTSNKLLNTMWISLKNVATYQISSMIFTGFITGIRNALDYVKDLDSAMNDIRIVTGMSKVEADKLAKSLNKMAKELKVGTTEMAQGMLIFQQQGDAMDLAMKKAEITTKAAKVAGTDIQQMSENLTALWNSFQVGEEELMKYTDILVALGAETATSFEEISTAITKVGATANAVGVNIEQLGATIATVSSVTRESAETTGVAFKTIYARMGDLQLGKSLDDGVTLGTVSSSLKTIGVDILNVNGEMKEIGDVVEEIGHKWDTLTQTQQVALAQVMGGKRQYTQLLALFENFDEYELNLKIADDAEGATEEQFDIWEERWEAASNKVTANVQELYSSLFDTDSFIKLTEAFAGIVDFVDDVIKGLGGLGNILMQVGAIGLMAFSNKIASGISEAYGNAKVFLGISRQQDLDMRNQLQTILRLSAARENLTEKEKVQIENQRTLNSLKLKYLENESWLSSNQKSQFAELIGLLQQYQEELENAISKKQDFDRYGAKEMVENAAQNMVDTTGGLDVDIDGDITKINNPESVNEATSSWGENVKVSANGKDLEGITAITSEYDILSSKLKAASSLQEQFSNKTQKGTKVSAAELEKFENELDEINSDLSSGIQVKLSHNKGDIEKTLTTLKKRIQETMNSIKQQTENNPVKIKFADAQGNPIEGTTSGRGVGVISAMFDDHAAESENNKEDIEDARQNVEDGKKGLEQTLDETKIQKVTQSFIGLASGIISVTQAVQMFKNMGSIWSDEDVSTGEKVISTVSQYAMMLMMLIPNFSKLLTLQFGSNKQTLIDIIQKKAQAVSTKLSKKSIDGETKSLWARFMAMVANNPMAVALAAGALALAAAVAISAKNASDDAKAIKENGNAKENAKKKTEELTKAVEDQKKALEEVTSELEKARNRLNELLGKPTLSFIEQQELENLREAIAILREKEEIENRKLKDAEGKADADAIGNLSNDAKDSVKWSNRGFLQNSGDFEGLDPKERTQIFKLMAIRYLKAQGVEEPEEGKHYTANPSGVWFNTDLVLNERFDEFYTKAQNLQSNFTEQEYIDAGVKVEVKRDDGSVFTSWGNDDDGNYTGNMYANVRQSALNQISEYLSEGNKSGYYSNREKELEDKKDQNSQRVELGAKVAKYISDPDYDKEKDEYGILESVKKAAKEIYAQMDDTEKAAFKDAIVADSSGRQFLIDMLMDKKGNLSEWDAAAMGGTVEDITTEVNDIMAKLGLDKKVVAQVLGHLSSEEAKTFMGMDLSMFKGKDVETIIKSLREMGIVTGQASTAFEGLNQQFEKTKDKSSAVQKALDGILNDGELSIVNLEALEEKFKGDPEAEGIIAEIYQLIDSGAGIDAIRAKVKELGAEIDMPRSLAIRFNSINETEFKQVMAKYKAEAEALGYTNAKELAMDAAAYSLGEQAAKEEMSIERVKELTKQYKLSKDAVVEYYIAAIQANTNLSSEEKHAKITELIGESWVQNGEKAKDYQTIQDIITTDKYDFQTLANAVSKIGDAWAYNILKAELYGAFVNGKADEFSIDGYTFREGDTTKPGEKADVWYITDSNGVTQEITEEELKKDGVLEKYFKSKSSNKIEGKIRESEDARKKYNEKVEKNITENLKAELNKRKKLIEKFDSEIEVLDWGKDFLGKDNYGAQMDITAKKLDLVKQKSAALAKEYETLKNTQTNSAEAAEVVANRMDEVAGEMRENLTLTKELHTELLTSGLDAISSIVDRQVDNYDRIYDALEKKINKIKGLTEEEEGTSLSLLDDDVSNVDLFIQSQSAIEMATKDQNKEDLKILEDQKEKELEVYQRSYDAQEALAVEARAEREKDIADIKSGLDDVGEKTTKVTDNMAAGFDTVLSSVNTVIEKIKNFNFSKFKEFIEWLKSQNGGKGSTIIEQAASYKGTPYTWGGGHNGKFDTLDCSGYVSKVLNDLGYINSTYSADGFKEVGTKIDPSEMQPGDLLIFDYKHDGKADHVAFYAGNGKMWHSTGGILNSEKNPGKGVELTDYSDLYKKALVQVNRVYATGTPLGNAQAKNLGIAGENYKPEILVNKATGEKTYIDEPTVIDLTKTEVIGEKQTANLPKFAKGTNPKENFEDQTKLLNYKKYLLRAKQRINILNDVDEITEDLLQSVYGVATGVEEYTYGLKTIADGVSVSIKENTKEFDKQLKLGNIDAFQYALDTAFSNAKIYQKGLDALKDIYVEAVHKGASEEELTALANQMNNYKKAIEEMDTVFKDLINKSQESLIAEGEKLVALETFSLYRGRTADINGIVQGIRDKADKEMNEFKQTKTYAEFNEEQKATYEKEMKSKAISSMASSVESIYETAKEKGDVKAIVEAGKYIKQAKDSIYKEIMNAATEEDKQYWIEEYNKLIEQEEGMDVKDTLKEKLSEAAQAEYDRDKKAIERLEERYGREIEYLEEINHAMEKRFDLENSILDSERKLNKELKKSMSSAAWLDEEQRSRIFNTETYARLSKELNKIREEADGLDAEYKAQIRAIKNDSSISLEEQNARIAELSAAYDHNYEMLMKGYEISKAELELTNKKQELNNVLNNKTDMMFVNGAWINVADMDKVQAAQEAVEDAQYEMDKMIREEEQAEDLWTNTSQVNAMNRETGVLNAQAEARQEKYDEMLAAFDPVIPSVVAVLSSIGEAGGDLAFLDADTQKALGNFYGTVDTEQLNTSLESILNMPQSILGEFDKADWVNIFGQAGVTKENMNKLISILENIHSREMIHINGINIYKGDPAFDALINIAPVMTS